MKSNESKIPDILRRLGPALMQGWQGELRASVAVHSPAAREGETTRQAQEFLDLLTIAAERGQLDSIRGEAWDDLRAFLGSVSREQALRGLTPMETATFVFSFKKSLFSRLREELGGDTADLLDEIWVANTLLDELGLFTIEIHQKAREEIIYQQQQEVLELSTPVVKLWEGILAVPLIGTLDSARTQVVMETLLNRIAETGASVAIIDITGVPMVDTLVAQHLLKTVAAARLMGADCIVSGVRPQIAQTIVHLGVDLADVVTRATLADAFALALRLSRSVPVATPEVLEA